MLLVLDQLGAGALLEVHTVHEVRLAPRLPKGKFLLHQLLVSEVEKALLLLRVSDFLLSDLEELGLGHLGLCLLVL